MITLRLLGSIDLRDERGEPLGAVLRRPKLLAILAYLAIARPRGFHRKDKLLALFWPESDQQRARHALRQALYMLRRALGEEALISRGDEEVGLNGEAVQVDVVTFEAALDDRKLKEAVRVYHGVPMEGFFLSDCPEFERWLEGERAWHRARVKQALVALADEETVAENPRAALIWATQSLDLNPHDEHAVRRLITLQVQLGDRATALATYEGFVQRLMEDLQVEPSAETQALAVAIRDAQTDAASVSPGQIQVAVASRNDPRASRWRPLAAATLLLLVGGGVWLTSGKSSSVARSSHPRTAIAVLPFQNLSAEERHAYFAGGLHDEILTQLSKVAALKVISRSSVMGYPGANTPPLRQIAAELAVGTVVEGSVQVVGDRLRVNVQLIDAATDQQLWAERYDRTLDDAFAVQSDIAQRIVAGVGAELRPREEQRLSQPPTATGEAYLLYLQGREYHSRPGYLRQHLEIAQQLYERALMLDSEYALARAALSEVHGWLYWYRYDPSTVRAARQREEAEAALRLAPELPQAHMAMGLVHHWARGDRTEALQEFEIALQGMPNDAWLWSLIGYVNRRLGNWKEVLAAYEKAIQLDPREADLWADLGGNTYHAMHRYAEAVRAYERALNLAPDLHLSAARRGWAYFHWQGHLDTLRAVLRRIPSDAELGAFGTPTAHHLRILHWERQADSLLQVVAMAPAPVLEGQDFFLPASLYAAWAHQLRGDGAAAHAAFDSALVLLDSIITELPGDWHWPVHAARGLALAGLRRRQQALLEAHWLEQSVVYREDAQDGPMAAQERARILAQVGEAEAALDEIVRLLKGPSRFSVHVLRLDPLWDPIRGHPRFQALLDRYETS